MKISDFTLIINNITVDTLPLFVQLAADTTSTYKEIDSLYEADKTRYQIAASRFPYVYYPLFTAGGIDRQIYALKYLGMVLTAIEAGRDSPLFEQILRILTKHWNDLYYYIKNSQTIDLSKAAKPEYYAKFANGQYHNLLTGAATKYLQSFIALYPAIDLPQQASLKFAMFMTCALGKKAIVSVPETLSIIQTLGSKLGSTSEFQQLRSSLNTPSVKKMARYLKNMIYQKAFPNYLEPWNGDRFWEGLAHGTAYLSSTIGISLFSPKLLTTIKERDVDLLCRLYILKMTADSFRYENKKSQEDMELDCAEFVMFGLSLLALIREYKKTRKYFFEHNTPFPYVEMNNLKKQLQTAATEIQIIRADLAAKTNLLALREEELHTLVFRHKFALKALNKKNELLKTRLAQAEGSWEKIKNMKIINSDNIVMASAADSTYESGKNAAVHKNIRCVVEI